MNGSFSCWKCGHEITDYKTPLPFREVCPKCDFWLHSCRNCIYYSPGKPNDCEVPGTEPVADREGCNFCDEFSPDKGKKPAGDSDSKKFNSLFQNEEDEDPPKKGFDDLFI